jgi:sugar lactone lactonase YvrE
MDGANLYVTDFWNNEIRMVSLTAPFAVTTIAGSTNAGSADDGTGTSATFNWPNGITTAGSYLYVTDQQNSDIRRISLTPPYAVTTIAGVPLQPYGTDGTGTDAKFCGPNGITTDGVNLYIADTGNSKIRQLVIGTNVVTTLAGNYSEGIAGNANDTGTAARFFCPYGITTDGVNLYVADTYNSEIRKVQ